MLTTIVLISFWPRMKIPVLILYAIRGHPSALTKNGLIMKKNTRCAFISH